MEVVRDPWLGAILGKPAACVRLPDNVVSSAEIVRALCEAGQREAGFAFAKTPTSSIMQMRALEEAGFRLVDTAMAFSRPRRAVLAQSCESIRFALPKDELAVRTIARDSFVFSRFHLDPLIPQDLAGEIKEQWAGNYFLGSRGDAMVVCESGGRVAGFLLLLFTREALVIDLIAVAPFGRRKGLARAMIEYAGQRLPAPPCIHVGTQAANIPSMRLYEKAGFSVTGSHYVFHRHAEDRGCR